MIGQTKVLIADDQALVRSGLRLILETQPDLQVIAEAANGREAINLALAHAPDVVLMDLRMPVLGGIEATRILVEDRRLSLRVLVLTTFDGDNEVHQAIRAGASGFLLKDSKPAVLLEAVRTVARGEAVLGPEATSRLLADFTRRPEPGAETSAPWSSLTERELQVTRLMATGMSNGEIAAEMFLAETTVKSHVASILAKLAVRDRVQVVVLAFRTGLVNG